MSRKFGPTSRPTPKMIRLYHALSDRYGNEPDDLWVYDPVELDNPAPFLTLKHVAVWKAGKGCGVTGFNTLGMSERKMKGARYFAELHLGYRGKLKSADRERLARYLVNVTEYPFHHGLKLDWWEVIKDPGDIPFFPGCRHILLHPRLTREGLDRIEDEDGQVKVLYVVPITPLERHLLVDHDRRSFLEYVEQNGIDLLADRTDPMNRTKGNKPK